MNRPLQRLWVIAYDIEDDATRCRIHNILKNHGQRVQYSVFECWLNTAAVVTLRQTLQQEIDQSDNIRWYPLCRGCNTDVQWQGKGDSARNEGYYLP